MPAIFTLANLVPCQVDDFGKDIERSQKGALHFKPSSMMEVTEGEFRHIREKHPKIAALLQVMTPAAQSAVKAEPVAAKVEAAEVKSDPEPVEAKAEEAEKASEPVEAAHEARPKKQKQKW